MDNALKQKIVGILDESTDSVSFLKNLNKGGFKLCRAQNILEDKIDMLVESDTLVGRMVNENEIINIHARDRFFCVEILGRNKTVEYFDID